MKSTKLLYTIIVFVTVYLCCVDVYRAQASESAKSEKISDQTYLRKLSFHLKGLAPSSTEYSELKSLRTAGEKETFFQNKISEYLISPEASDKMVFRLSERFQIQTPSIDLQRYAKLPLAERQMIAYQGYFQDSMTDMFARMARENLSWDFLLTGKSYNLFADKEPNLGNMSDYAFFKTLKADLPESEPQGYNSIDSYQKTGIPVSFQENDSRIAGVLTTPRFLSRFNTTNINRNRKRAAAVFKIFLCDPMFPIIPPPPDRKTSVLNQAFDDVKHGDVSEKQLQNSFTLTDSMRHGADKQCAACHYKLDPMGKTFQNIGMVMNPIASKGTLTFLRPGGEVLKTALNGVGDLGAEIVKQPEYVSCQVDWLWKQYIGSDVILSGERKAELIEKFNSVGRKSNDFIRVLVSAAEFRNRPKRTDKISFAQVSSLLKRCDSCHEPEGYISSLSTGRLEKTQLLKARHRLNLPDSHKDKMPRDWLKWDQKDVDTLKRWLEQGAVDQSEQKTLSDEDLAGAK
jgi:hypothetical protein